MPFGLKNAGMMFKCYMDHIFNKLEFIFIYVDNILVASRSWQEHLLHLQEVLRWLQQAGLILNLAKCTFDWPSVEFLGYQVSRNASTLWLPRWRLFAVTPGLQQSRSFSSFLAC